MSATYLLKEKKSCEYMINLILIRKRFYRLIDVITAIRTFNVCKNFLSQKENIAIEKA